MFDAALRNRIEPALTATARRLDRGWISPDRLTVAGLVLGLGSAVLAADRVWVAAAALWLISRLLDGLDGALARLRSSTGPGSPGGGFLDITGDFVVYGSGVLGVGIGATGGYGAPWWPFGLVLLAYYVNGSAFLAYSSIAERTGATIDDGRSLSFFGRIAEATETIIVHTLWLLFPIAAAPIAIIWAGFVSLSATQRILSGYRLLSRATPAQPADGEKATRHEEQQR